MLCGIQEQERFEYLALYPSILVCSLVGKLCSEPPDLSSKCPFDFAVKFLCLSLVWCIGERTRPDRCFAFLSTDFFHPGWNVGILVCVDLAVGKRGMC